jgi:enoyl-CoA hydratase/carnithine racemase
MSADGAMKHWRVERHDDGVVVAAYRNDPMNYFFADGAAEFAELVDTWADPSVRAVVLTGDVPGKFLTHYSVEELVAVAEDREALASVCPQLTDGYHALLEQMRSLPKPVIVAMTGDTMGGGFELSMAADIRIAEDGPYRIGLLETKLGIIPGGSGTQRLVRMLGPAAAVEIVMRGRVFTPHQAAERGLVHEAVPDAKARALEIAHELAAMSPVAIAQAKRAVYEGVDRPLADGLKIETDAFLQTMLSDEGLDTMRRYVATPLEQRRAWAEPEADAAPAEAVAP